MNAAATAVMEELPDIICAYGVSDEFRHATGPQTVSLTLIVSLASYLTDQVDCLKGERGKCADFPRWEKNGLNFCL